MIIWAIVPVKPLRRGKSRLAPVFSPEERTYLNKQLLRHTLETLQTLPEIEYTLVVSRDPEALALARQYRTRTISEEGEPQLNTALTRATALARIAHISAVLILPADLPQISKADLQTLIAHAHNPPVVVIAPDHKNDGTNALLVNPAGIIPYEFGPGSFQRHCDRARAAGARLEIIHREGLALDLDEPDDLALMDEVTLAPFLISKAEIS